MGMQQMLPEPTTVALPLIPLIRVPLAGRPVSYIISVDKD